MLRNRREIGCGWVGNGDCRILWPPGVLVPLIPFAVLCFWNWFGLPIGLPHIDLVEAWGLSLAVGLVAVIAWPGSALPGSSDLIFVAKLGGIAVAVAWGFAVHVYGHALVEMVSAGFASASALWAR